MINPIVFAEVSAGFESVDDVEAALPAEYVGHTLLTRDARRYRYYFPTRVIAP